MKSLGRLQIICDVILADLLPRDIQVYGGKLKTDIALYERYQQNSPVVEILLHPDYNSETFHADIAILRLQLPFVFTEGLKVSTKTGRVGSARLPCEPNIFERKVSLTNLIQT